MQKRVPLAPSTAIAEPTSLFQQAVALHQQGQLQDAERLYRAVLAGNRRHAGALHLLGVLQGRAGRFAEAARLIRKSIQENPRAADAHRDLANICLVLGRVDEAITRFAAATVLRPDAADLHASLANALARRNRYEEALAAFEKAIALKPSADVHHGAGFVLAALSRHADACIHFEKALALNPGATEARYNLANSLAAQNRRDDAISQYEHVIAADPKHVGAHNNLATALVVLGRHQEAVAPFERALALAPDNVSCLGNMGTILTTLGRAAEALGYCERAVALAPDDAKSHLLLANALAALNRHDQAIASYERAAALQPDYVDAPFNLANSLRQIGRPADAVAAYERVIHLKPDYLQALNNLGNALLDLTRPADALSRLRQALAVDPESPEAHNNCGCALHALSRHEEALVHYERALALKPGYADAHMNTGNSLLELGRLDEARQAFEAAIRLAPRNPKYYRNLIDLKRFSADDPHLIAMQDLAGDMPSFSAEGQTELHFALGKAVADAGRPDDAFQHLLAANALKRRFVRYDEAAMLDLMSRLASTFTPELMRAYEGAGDPSRTPIFIIGMPRSGTTLIEQILASHSKVFGAGELPLFADKVLALKVLDSFIGTAAQQAGDKLLRELGHSYLEGVRGLAPAAARITDKMPLNFRFAGLIHLALPNARIIHARRNPLDTCLSCFSKLFTGDQPFTYDLGELGRHYRAYHSLMAHWRRVLPAHVFLEIDYETMVADTERQARRLLTHCGLEWEDACLQFHRTERLVRTASATQVRQPIYKTSVGRSQVYRAMLQPLIEALGPELAGGV